MMGPCALDVSSVPAVLPDVLKGSPTAVKLPMGRGLLLFDQVFWGINENTKGSYRKKAA